MGRGCSWYSARMPFVPFTLHIVRGGTVQTLPEVYDFFSAGPERRSTPLTHLFYADDAVVMVKATVRRTLMRIFQQYCGLSGLSWNKEKSVMVVSKRAPIRLRRRLRRAMGIKTVKEVGLYLGVPLTDGVPRLMHFDALRARISVKQNSWRGRNNSVAGRICLLNYSLLPVLFHTLAHCKVLQKRASWTG